MDKCWVVRISKGKPKVKKGTFEPENNFGLYGKQSFGIPTPEDAKKEFQTPVTYDRSSLPVFIVDAETELAHSVGNVSCTDQKLSAKLEVVGNKKYVKAMVMKVFDLTQTLILLGAGAGVTLALLIVISNLTGNPIVFGAPSP